MADGGGGERLASRVVQYFLDPRFPSLRMQVISLASAITSQE